MKKIIGAFFVMLILVGGVFAQTTTDNVSVIHRANGLLIQYDALALDSAETVWSQEFDISEYDNVAFTTNTAYDFINAATADSVNIAAYWFVAYDNSANANWIVADTIATITSTTAAKGTFDLNNVHAPYNKIKVVNNAGSSAQTALELSVYFPVKDQK